MWCLIPLNLSLRHGLKCSLLVDNLTLCLISLLTFTQSYHSSTFRSFLAFSLPLNNSKVEIKIKEKLIYLLIMMKFSQKVNRKFKVKIVVVLIKAHARHLYLNYLSFNTACYLLQAGSSSSYGRTITIVNCATIEHEVRL